MNKMILKSADRYERLISEKAPTPETIGDKWIMNLHVGPTCIRNKLDRELILDFLSPKMKRRAEAPVSLTCLDWDNKGQLIYRGSAVNGSHIW